MDREELVSRVQWEEVNSCPICGSEEIRIHAIVNNIEFGKCLICDIVFQRRRVSNREEYYKELYRPLLFGESGIGERDMQVQVDRAKFVAHKLAGINEGSHMRHLDIGSSSGALCLTLAQNFGWESYGNEWDDYYRGVAEGAGVKHLTMDEAVKLDFGVITMIHVLEHMVDPIGFLRSLPNTEYLAVEVPNGRTTHDAYVIHHPIVYTDTTLPKILYRSGFKVLHKADHGLYLPIDRYIFILAVKETE